MCVLMGILWKTLFQGDALSSAARREHLHVGISQSQKHDMEGPISTRPRRRHHRIGKRDPALANEKSYDSQGLFHQSFTRQRLREKMLRIPILSTRLLVRRTPMVVAAARSYATGNEGRQGPLTGAKKQDKNAGREGPLTGKSKSSVSAPKQEANAEASESTEGAESSSPPKTAPGQGMEDKGGHAVPSGPGSDGKFAEQGDSALNVASPVDGEGSSGKDADREKVDSKFWSDKKDK